MASLARHEALPADVFLSFFGGEPRTEEIGLQIKMSNKCSRDFPYYGRTTGLPVHFKQVYKAVPKISFKFSRE